MSELICTTDDKVLVYKALSGAGAIQLSKSPIGIEFIVAEVIQSETANKEGEVCTATVIIGEDGNVYQTLSPTLAEDVRTLYNIFGDEIRGKKLRLITGTSNSGNKFFKLDLIS